MPTTSQTTALVFASLIARNRPLLLVYAQQIPFPPHTLASLPCPSAVDPICTASLPSQSVFSSGQVLLMYSVTMQPHQQRNDKIDMLSYLWS